MSRLSRIVVLLWVLGGCQGVSSGGDGPEPGATGEAPAQGGEAPDTDASDEPDIDVTPSVSTPASSPTPTSAPTPDPILGGPEHTPPAPKSAFATFTSTASSLDPHSRLFEIELTLPAPLELRCTEPEVENERHLIVRDTGDYHQFALRGLKANTEYICVAMLLDGNDTVSSPVVFRTDPLPDDIGVPDVTRVSISTSSIGYTLYNYAILEGNFTYTSRYLVLIDAEANVRWRLSGIGGGTIDASYLGGDTLLYGGRATYSVLPTIVDLDLEARFIATDEVSVSAEYPGSYHHDAGLSEKGDSIFTLVHTELTGSYLGFAIKQLDLNNNVLWIWDAEQDGIMNGVLPPGAEDNPDPHHANSVFDRWEEGRLFVYVGLKTTNSVLKIDYDTKEVVWQIGVGGDFQLLENDGAPAEDHRWFFGQHDAKLYGPDLVLYDNGLKRRDYGGEHNYSRAIQLELDEEAMTARIVFEYDDPSWLEPVWGGADRLPNGRYLIAIGHCWDCSYEENKSAIIEVDSSGEEVWRVDFAEPEDAIYRAERIDGCDIFNNLTYCPELERAK